MILFVEIAEAARVARTGPSTIRDWIVSGRLQSVRPGRRRLIPVSDLARLLGVTPDEIVAALPASSEAA